jgi:mono/diheme cytochrome c family protein
MALTRTQWIRIVLVVVLAAAALFLIKLHGASGQAFAQEQAGAVYQGGRLADAWCTECHSVERRTDRTGTIAPDFSAIANRRGTTELSLKTFLRSDHKTMPNFIIEPYDADVLVAYILSLRRR